MAKKIILACMAVVAFAAFVLPASASASPELTHPTGTTYCKNGGSLGEPCLVTGTNVGNWTFTSSLGTITCSSVVITGNVTKNNGTEVEGDITSATFGGTGTNGDCTGPLGISINPTTNVGNGLPWCLRATKAMEPDEFQVRGNACNAASRSITFVLDGTGWQDCYYDRAAVVKGTFTTDTTSGEDAVLTFANQEWTLEKEVNTNPFLPGCPSSGKLNGSATLETDSKTVEPMYIS